MDELRKIANIITKRGVRNVPLLNIKRDLDQSGLENQLFYNIQDELYDEDLNASMDIYNSKATDHRYKMLKSRVRQKMLNHLLFLDQEDPNLKKEVVLQEECLRLVNMGWILVLEKEFDIAEKLINRSLNLASEAEFTEIVIDSLELLKIVYAEKSRPLLLQKSIAEIEDKRSFLSREKEAENMYLKDLVILNKSYNARLKYMDEIAEDLVGIKAIYDETGSFNVFMNYYDLFIKYHLVQGEFYKVIELTSHISESSETFKLNERRFESMDNKYHLLYALFRNCEFNKVLEIAEDQAEKADSSSNHWIRINDIYFLALMHIGQYSKAMQVVQEVIYSKIFDQQDEDVKTQWIIYIGFLSFIGIKKTIIRRYSMNKIYNSLPDRDSANYDMNLTILILQLVIAIKEGRIELIEPLNNEINFYVYKHPLTILSTRSRMFLKLINVMLKSDLDHKVCKKRGRYLYQQLKNTRQNGDAYSGLEVIPYEVIWEIILTVIEKETLALA